VRPGEQLGGEPARHAEEIGDHAHGEWRGVVGHEVALSGRREPIDEFVGEPLDGRGEAIDLPRKERGVHEAAEPAVPRRFQFQQRVLFEGMKRPQMGGGFRPAKFSPGGDVQDLPTEPPIAEERVDVVVVRGAAVPELSPGEHAAEIPHRRIERIRIADKRLIARIEVVHQRVAHAITMQSLDPLVQTQHGVPRRLASFSPRPHGFRLPRHRTQLGAARAPGACVAANRGQDGEPRAASE
jgi:hypothetical protein